MSQPLQIPVIYYLEGRGLDTSRYPLLKEAEHYFREPDNLYRYVDAEGNAKPYEQFDFVFNDCLFNETKFFQILIKEWFGLVRIGGHVVFRFTPTQQLSLATSIDEVTRLVAGKGTVLYHECDKSLATIIIKKHQSIFVDGDDMNKWTFGIITIGNRNEWVEQIIERIRSLQILQYEIIICGKYYDRKESDVRYIHFEEKDDLGWITRKKNLICAVASYENIYVTNDRIIPELGWWEGMKRYGNYFESLGCIQTLKNGQRVGDWMTFGVECTKSANTPFTLGLLDYRDWDHWSYVVGSLNIIKKSIWKISPWDENLFWVDAVEDGVFCHELMKKGYLTRFNPYAYTQALTWRHGVLPSYVFNKFRLGRRYGVPLRRFGWACLRIAGKFGFQNAVSKIIAPLVRKIGLYNYIIKN